MCMMQIKVYQHYVIDTVDSYSQKHHYKQYKYSMDRKMHLMTPDKNPGTAPYCSLTSARRYW